MSTGNSSVVARCLSHAQNVSDDPKDIGVFFDGGFVTKAKLLQDLTVEDAFTGGSGSFDAIVEWMEARHLQPTDELIIYTNGNFYQPIEKPWWTLHLRLLTETMELDKKQLVKEGIPYTDLKF